MHTETGCGMMRVCPNSVRRGNLSKARRDLRKVNFDRGRIWVGK
jgi:hypothetical protein